MIVKNEEASLTDCLLSVQGAVDEIIIVDTGSSDSTIAIANSFGAKIFSFPWANDFSAARNTALAHASGSWVLYLDADERLDPASISELRRLTQKNDRTGVLCTLRSIDKTGGRPNIMRYYRLFAHHPSLRFVGKVHEQIFPSMQELGYRFVESSIAITHIGYDIPLVEMQKKAKRNLNLLLIEASEHPTGYVHFQIGQTYAVLQDKRNAEISFLLALGMPDLEPYYRSHALRFCAALDLERGKNQEALTCILQALQLSPGQPLVQLIAAKVYFSLGAFEKAENAARNALTANEELLNGKRIAQFDTLVEHEELLFYLLELALRYKRAKFFSELRACLAAASSSGSTSAYSEAELIDKILQNGSFTGEDEQTLCSLLNEKNISFFLSLMRELNQDKLLLQIAAAVENRFSDHVEFNRIFALSLFAEGNFAEADAHFARCESAEPENPAHFLYRLSIAVHTKTLPEISAIIASGKERFHGKAAVLEKLAAIGTKLNIPVPLQGGRI